MAPAKAAALINNAFHNGGDRRGMKRSGQSAGVIEEATPARNLQAWLANASMLALAAGRNRGYGMARRESRGVHLFADLWPHRGLGSVSG